MPRGRWSTEDCSGEHRRHGDADHRAARRPNWKRRCDQGDDDPETPLTTTGMPTLRLVHAAAIGALIATNSKMAVAMTAIKRMRSRMVKSCAGSTSLWLGRRVLTTKRP